MEGFTLELSRFGKILLEFINGISIIFNGVLEVFGVLKVDDIEVAF
jgi:hypothetical protein